MKKIGFFNCLALLLGTLCLLYYLFCGTFFGFGVSILYVWLMASALLLAKGAVSVVWRLKGKRGRFLRLLDGAANAVMTLAIVIVAVFCGMVARETCSVPPDDLPCVVILGARVRGSSPSLALSLRIDAAYDYLAAHPETVAVCSGGKGNGEDLSEADCIAGVLISRGIAPDRLYREDASTDTIENLANTAAILQEKGIGSSRVGIVTNGFHLLRAKALARRALGRDTAVFSVPAPFIHPLTPHYIARELVAFVMETGELAA